MVLVKAFEAKLEAVTTADPSKDLHKFSVVLRINTVKPTSYESYYTAALRKVELSQRDEFSLDDQEFQRYILNNWEWKSDFLNNATTYLGSSSQAVSGLLLSGINKFNK